MFPCFVNAYRCAQKYTNLCADERIVCRYDRLCPGSCPCYSPKTRLKRFRQRIRVGPTLPTAISRLAATSA